ncbi:MAG: diguanylate cyclase [Planctomycetaceae bacterium]|nr:diguanylate cyclase [Planctomycetaceae bacterium]MBT6486752.1 diguanylate cyclase [Planctomycetaceae bacterium]MBT6493725.1 diguanylate cyclase [Planctomycetaceae bacterium]
MSAPTAADVDFLKQQQTFAAHVGRDRNGDFMVAGRLISDEIFSPKGGERRSVPRDSSRLLLGLTTLARLAELKSQNRSSSDPLEGIVSRPILRMLLGALGYREPDFVAHARRVAILAAGTADYLGWETRQRKLLEVSSLVHDIGKIGIPDHILFKCDKLSSEESELLNLHRNIGINVLQAAGVDSEVLSIVSEANSHFNGATNGFRRIGSDVHQGARILAVADAYDVLRRDTENDQPLRHDEIIRTMMESAGSRFDGNVIRALNRWIENAGLPFADEDGGQGHAAVAAPDTGEKAVVDASFLCHIFSYLYFVESMYDGLCLLDSNLRYVVWNNGLEKLLGRRSDDVLGRNWSSREVAFADSTGREHTDSDNPIQRAIEGGKSHTSTSRVQHVDGNWIEVELQSIPLFDQAGHLHGVAQIFQDKSSGGRVPEYHELKMAASRDALTGVANRGELERQLATMVAEYNQQTEPEPFSVIFLDIDFFKSVNDNFGHAAGDQVLVDLSKLLQHEVYSGELIARYGGEEFVVLCPGTDLDQARRRAERLRTAIFETQIGDLPDHRITSSFGVTEIEPDDTAVTVLSRADNALYISKESGRNRTTALTRALAKSQVDVEAAPAADNSPSPQLTETFDACVAADMIVYKLGGFIDDHRARLIEVKPEFVKMQVGRRGLLPFWGSRDDRRPVLLEIKFGDGQSSRGHGAKKTAAQTKMTVSVQPIGWIRDQEQIEQRARRVIKDLRSYFVAN